MSTLKGKADLEAAIADLDLDETEAKRVEAMVADGADPFEAAREVYQERDGANPQPDVETPADEATGEPTKRQLKDLERAIGTHLEHVASIMGAHVAGFVVCDKCGAAGLIPPEPPVKENENFIACPTCNGYGAVLTGARNEAHYTRSCPSCGGRGYLELLDSTGAPVAAGGAAVAAVPPDGVTPSPAEPATAAAPPPDGPTFGVPAWMGDPAIGQP